MTPTGRLGVYVHVPFCAAHCPYCDFTVAVVRDIPHEAYADAIAREWAVRQVERDGRALRTLYFGGGTPGLWDPSALARTIATIGGQPEEVTLEVNPEFCDAERLRAWRAAGVNRISLGTQSFCDTTLARLGRAHTGEEARAAVLRAHEAGFERVSVDLMFAVPGEPRGRLERDLAAVTSLPVEHVSAYELTVEPRTAWAARVARGELAEYDEARAVDASRRISEALAGAGFARYEVSSFAREGGESLHNSAYWVGDEYLGLGVGAHSLRIDGGVATRRANARSLKRYLEGRAQPPELERLSPEEHARELVMVGLRTAAGVDLDALARRVAPLPGVRDAALRWRARGWVTMERERVRVQGEGWLWLDTMSAEALSA